MKHNKNADTLLFQLLFAKSQREKKNEKTFIASAGAQKRWKTVDSSYNLSQYLLNPKNKFPVKYIFTYSIFVLLSID